MLILKSASYLRLNCQALMFYILSPITKQLLTSHLSTLASKALALSPLQEIDDASSYLVPRPNSGACVTAPHLLFRAPENEAPA